MTQEKLRRVVVAASVAGTTLLVVLLSVLIYQFVTWGVYNKRIEKLEEENAQLTQENEVLEKDLGYYTNELGKFFLAFEHGFVWGDK